MGFNLGFKGLILSDTWADYGLPL